MSQPSRQFFAYMNTPSSLTRRSFLEKTPPSPPWASPPRRWPCGRRDPGLGPPNSRIHLGLIGCGGMGRANLGACANSRTWSSPPPAMSGRRGATRWSPSSRTPARRYARLPRDAAAEGPRRRDHRHAAALARAPGHRRLRGGQGHLPAEADDAAPGREPGGAQRRARSTTASARSAPRSTPARTTGAWSSSSAPGNLGPIGVVRTFNVMNQAPEGVGRSPRTRRRPTGWTGTSGAARRRMRPFNPHPRRRRLQPLLVDGLQRRLDARHGAAHHRPADLGAGPGLSRSSPARPGGRYVIKDDGDAYDHHEVLWQYPELAP